MLQQGAEDEKIINNKIQLHWAGNNDMTEVFYRPEEGGYYTW